MREREGAGSKREREREVIKCQVMRRAMKKNKNE